MRNRTQKQYGFRGRKQKKTDIEYCFPGPVCVRNGAARVGGDDHDKEKAKLGRAHFPVPLAEGNHMTVDGLYLLAYVSYKIGMTVAMFAMWEKGVD